MTIVQVIMVVLGVLATLAIGKLGILYLTHRVGIRMYERELCSWCAKPARYAFDKAQVCLCEEHVKQKFPGNWEVDLLVKRGSLRDLRRAERAAAQ